MSSKNKYLKLKKYKIYKNIGSGAFSTVYLVKSKKNRKYYAAKISNLMVDEDSRSDDEVLILFREINLLSLLNHPSVIKFYGYSPINFENDPQPTILTEYARNGSLHEMLELEKSGLSPKDWDQSKKIIIAYGIACGMSYLHSNSIIHRDLKPHNILLDSYLYPKISDFGLSRINEFISASMNFASRKGLKGTPIYTAPEIFENNDYTFASDVYAFGIIIFQIFTLDDPFPESNIYGIIKSLIDGNRPQIKDDVPEFFKDLIKRCWSQDPKSRPTFAQITEEMKNIDIANNDDKFIDYIDYIDKFKFSFDPKNRIFNFDEFIKSYEKTKKKKRRKKKRRKKKEEKKKEEEKKEEEEKEEEKEEEEEEKEEEEKSSEYNSDYEEEKEEENDKNYLKKLIMPIENQEKQHPISYKKMQTEYDPKKIQEEEYYHIIFPLYELNNLKENCKRLVEESEKDSEKLFEVAKSLLEGTNDFPLNIALGKEYLNQSFLNNFPEAIIYYVKMLIKGHVVHQDFHKAQNILDNHNIDPIQSILLRGCISQKQKKYSEAKKHYEEGIKLGDFQCMYEYAIILFKCQGFIKNDKKAFEYFNISSNNGYIKSQIFLTRFNKFAEIKEFSKLNRETQLFFVKNSLIIDHDIFNQLTIQPNKTEMLFVNKSFKSNYFHSILYKYKSILIKIGYPSKLFSKIFELINMIRNKKQQNKHRNCFYIIKR